MNPTTVLALIGALASTGFATTAFAQAPAANPSCSRDTLVAAAVAGSAVLLATRSPFKQPGETSGR